MKIKRTFSEHLQNHKKLVLILMILVIVIGIIRIFYQRSKSTETKTENLEEAAYVEIKESVFNNGGVGVMDLMDIYSEIKELDAKDTLKIEKMNEKLDKIIKK